MDRDRRPDPSPGEGNARPAHEEAASGGWLAFLKRVWQEVQEDDVLGQAAKVAYFAFLSLPPALLVIFGLTGFFGGEKAAQWMTEQLSAAFPPEAFGLIRQFVEEVAREQAPGPFSVGLVLALWASSTVFVALADALNKAYDVEDGRSWLRRRVMALGVMLVFAVLFLVASIALLAGPEIANALRLGAVWSYAYWPLAFLLIVGAFWIIYYVLPCRDQSREKLVILRGAFIGALLWVAATGAFRLYVSNFSSYSDTYGFLGAFIVLLLWMYVTGLVVLLGGEINSEIRWPRGGAQSSA
jgi:membrane protein